VRGAVLVCPGGGYAGRAPHEADPIAHAFNAHGFHAFVVHYRVKPCRHPAPLSDAVHAMRTIRRHATEWGVSPGHIGVCGFSAGGHLAGSLGVLHDQIPPAAPDDPSGRPDAMILSYAVLSSKAQHKGSFDNLLGPDADDALRNQFSIDRHVNANTPPAFLWHTADDGAVPVENALLMAMALRSHNVPFELHVFPHGPHGVGLATDPARNLSPRISAWVGLCCGWLDELGWPK
jgi:acetyl esterase/lipase